MVHATFSNRFEIKYLVDTNRIDEIKDKLLGFFEPDPYSATEAGYYVYSVYFDSPRFNFYREKREGQLQRIKPRIRTYLPSLSATPQAFFLELKGRHDRVVMKRREPISRDLAETLLHSPKPAISARDLESPTLSEFLYLTNRDNLIPCVTVMYRREPYNAAFYPGVRLTFDTRLQSSFKIGLENGQASFSESIPFDKFVLELKYNEKIPRLFLDRVLQLELKQLSISKFTTALDKTYDALSPRRRGLSAEEGDRFYGSQ